MGLVCRRALLRMETWLAGGGRLVAHYGGTKALVVLGGDKHTRDELVSAALGSLDRALLERVLFRCGSVEGAGETS